MIMSCKDYNKEHDLLRKQLWIRVVSAYISSDEYARTDNAIDKADKLLKRFDFEFENKTK